MNLFFRLSLLALVLFSTGISAGINGINQTSLNINVLSFSASSLTLAGNVRIKWSTASEKNLKEFNIYRSVDEQNWYLVGQFPAKNANSERNYEFIDRTASGGINFYKLEAVDLTGNKEALKYTKIELDDYERAVRVYPDAQAGRIKLESAEQLFTIETELTDIFDRQFTAHFVRDNTHEITMITGKLIPGFYILKCYINKQRYVRKKILIIDELNRQ